MSSVERRGEQVVAGRHHHAATTSGPPAPYNVIAPPGRRSAPGPDPSARPAPPDPPTRRRARPGCARPGRSSPARIRSTASRFSAPATVTITSRARAIAGKVKVRRGCGCASSPVATTSRSVSAERGAAGEQRRGVAVGSEAEVHDVDRRRGPDDVVVHARGLLDRQRAGTSGAPRGPTPRRATRAGPCPRWSRGGRAARSARRRSTRRPPTTRPARRATRGSTPRPSRRPRARSRQWSSSATSCANASGTSSTTCTVPGSVTSAILPARGPRQPSTSTRRARRTGWCTGDGRCPTRSRSSRRGCRRARRGSISAAVRAGTPPSWGRRSSRRTPPGRCSTWSASTRPVPAVSSPTSKRCRSHRARWAASGRTSATCTSRPKRCRSRSPTRTGRCRSAARCTSRSRRTASRRTSTICFPGRHFEWWPAGRLHDVVVGAGFEIDSFVDDGEEWLDVEATRARTLADTVGPGMRLLVVGLNPSVYSADAGHGFARPGNRFWPAALEAGIVTRAHDPRHALLVDRVGMTDLVKRATPRADDLTRDEFRDRHRAGRTLGAMARAAAPCASSGSTGYRAALDRKAQAGWQPRDFGGRPAYVMPNTSGINAHAHSPTSPRTSAPTVLRTGVTPAPMRCRVTPVRSEVGARATSSRGCRPRRGTTPRTTRRPRAPASRSRRRSRRPRRRDRRAWRAPRRCLRARCRRAGRLARRERVDRCLRERVDGVAADQRVDVERGGVRRVLRRRRRPQRALHPRALRRERVPARARRTSSRKCW